MLQRWTARSLILSATTCRRICFDHPQLPPPDSALACCNALGVPVISARQGASTLPTRGLEWEWRAWVGAWTCFGGTSSWTFALLASYAWPNFSFTILSVTLYQFTLQFNRRTGQVRLLQLLLPSQSPTKPSRRLRKSKSGRGNGATECRPCSQTLPVFCLADGLYTVWLWR